MMTTPPGRWFEDQNLHLGLGIENTFVPQSRPDERAIDEYELTEHYERFAEDFALAAGVGATVLRAAEAENMLRGTTLDAATVRSAANKAMEECTPISNVRASADYRRDMVGVLTGRAIKQALETFA